MARVRRDIKFNGLSKLVVYSDFPWPRRADVKSARVDR
eukprot:SAG31_NODE_17090_length_684_cov_0.685470_2_plen_37_part_01